MTGGTMRAMVRRGSGLEVVKVPDVVPGPGQLVGKTLACGICGSDLHAVHQLDHMVEMGLKSGSADTIDPRADLVLGHEFCVEVLDYGPGAERRFKPGTKVVSRPYNFSALGPELIGFSTRYKGGFAERLVLTEAICLEVPNGLPAERAALTEPLSVGAHAVAVAAPGPRSVAVVIGCGPIGLAVIAALKRQGVGPIIASDYSPERRLRAERLGADILVDPARNSPHAHWSAFDVPANLAEYGLSVMGGRSLRDAIIFECVGAPGVIASLVEQSPPTAHIVVVGACQEDDTFLPVLAINKQLRLSFVFGFSAQEFADTLHALGEGEINSDVFLTDFVTLDQAPTAFAQLAHPADQVKVMVEPWR